MTMYLEPNDRDARKDASIHLRFAEQVARTPDAPALVWRDQEISYREVHEHSNRLAHFLSRRGVGPETCVALCVERSPSMIVALLGILKAGAAYVPLDPDYPIKRLQYVLDDVDAKLLLTQQQFAQLFPAYRGQIVALEAFSDDIETMPSTALRNAVSAQNLVYVIHTSGSTGKPKGVLVTHGSLVNHAVGVNEHFALGPGDRVLQCRSLSFDAAAEEIFVPLVHGATLILSDDPLRQTFRSFTQQLIETKTSFISIPTAFWHSWVLEEDCLVRLITESSLRFVLVAGEKAHLRALSAWRRVVGDRIRWCNVYGPTEGTIATAVYEPAEGWENGDYTSVPIGRPIAGVQAYVLDPQMAPVPEGAAGELYIGGKGVARGYHGAPAATAERFVPDPFSKIPGARLYRTGDIVRSHGGVLEFVGRRDHQIKIRGYRIELGEVELAVLEHPAVRACAAVVIDDGSDDKRLLCYLAEREDASVDLGELRKHLRQQLPWYMIPSSLLIVTELPMTPNGKVDRDALVARGVPSDLETGHYIPPRTSVEASVATIWEDVLNRQHISVDADFFQVGGHSLLAAGLISRVRSELGVKISARVLFESPTIEGIAAAIGRAASEAR